MSEAKLDGLTFHGLRHSAVGFLIELGAHPRVMQQRMGHASYRTTMDVYGSVLPAVDDAVTTGLGDLFAASCHRCVIARRLVARPDAVHASDLGK